jgi:hypothetical protein
MWKVPALRVPPYRCGAWCIHVDAVPARKNQAGGIDIAKRHIGVDPLGAQLIINRRLTHGATL